MNLLVSPIEPRIRPMRDDALTFIEHKIYDGSRSDNFKGVSMHLSFTEWKMPLDWNSTGEIDQEIRLLESIVSVQSNGEWVADIDVLRLEKQGFDTFRSTCREHPSGSPRL